MIAVEEPSLDDVYAVVEEVWTTFLGSDEPILPAFEPQPGPIEGWTAAVTVTGAWEAMVLVTLGDRLSRTMTGRMLGIADDESSSEDLTDALGELVNVIGGNVKSLMAGPSTLSLPLVAQGAISTTSHLEEACRVDLTWSGDPLRVTVCVPRAEGEHR
ncbi:MAG: chemotaxis protein CheX [Actinobacteria bacterium]|uniref:Unannotated protein n=1 Tax=freshwater metagenome TaxID=449393 RepID=A0A6J6QKS8_9ZZZZ|nr:chemotaxis protein CheX [Actinomycetota bacterium]